MTALVTKKGDTLIEVVLSFVMFSLVAAISISVMHASISGAEAAIELTLARVEINTQSEVLRFIQESFANDRSYANLWSKITELALPKNSENIPELSSADCNKIYSEFNESSSPGLTDFNAFVVNARQINNGTDQLEENYYGHTLISSKVDRQKFSTSSLNPRVIYTVEEKASEDNSTTDSELMASEDYKFVYRAEGIYDFLVAGISKSELDLGKKPSHYDLHVYTCWFTPGAERPTTIGTVTRLYNPEFIDAN